MMAGTEREFDRTDLMLGLGEIHEAEIFYAEEVPGGRRGDVELTAGYPRTLVDRLEALARATGESMNDILVDALALHLDDLDLGDPS